MTFNHAIAEPAEGFYRKKNVKDGPWVPVQIARFCLCSGPDGEITERHLWNEDTCDRYPPLSALDCGVEIKDAPMPDDWGFMFWEPITEKKYDYLLKMMDWAEQHAPSDPYANTDKALDHMKVKSLF